MSGGELMAKQKRMENLETEKQNPKTINIDTMSSVEMAKLMNDEDKDVAFAVEKVLSSISRLSDKISQSIKEGGRCFYVGAGTSGRLGIIDAAETVPTFNLAYGTFSAILAGGEEAMMKSIENVEDDESGGSCEIEKNGISSKDTVIGISASGRTPYVMGALKKAKEKGAFTGCVVNVKKSEISSIVDIAIEILTGPEVITGSTRLKAGTSQKMVLNMLSTISMVKLGKVYKNLMVDVTPINEKLVNRAVRIIMTATGISREESFNLLKESEMRPKVAIVMALTNRGSKDAERLLEIHEGKIKDIFM